MGVRADRLISVGVVRPALRMFPGRETLRVPILMYHSIGTDLDSNRAPYYRTVTSAEVFARSIGNGRSSWSNSQLLYDSRIGH